MNFNENLNCKSCSKESYAKVPIARVIEKLDELFSRNDLSSVGRLLEYWENEARALRDDRGLLEILNEEIGYFRRTSEKEKGIAAVNEAFALLEKNAVSDTVTAGTVYLNGATTMKAFGMAREAMPYYEKAQEIYESNLEANDYKLAAFYNNISSAYKDIGDFKNAEDACYTAIEILESKGGYLGEIAVTLVNIAHLYHERDPLDERIYELMERAWSCLSSNKNTHDGNFAFICSKCYPSFEYFGYFEQAAKLKELTEFIYAGN
jgi:tetratricopeptide (TPR) repeat protein